MIYDIPNVIHLEITTRCRLACLKCPRNKEEFKENLNKDMPFELFEKIIVVLTLPLRHTLTSFEMDSKMQINSESLYIVVALSRNL